METNVTNTFKVEIWDFRKEMSKQIANVMREMKDSFDESSGNQEIMKEDIRFLKRNMMIVLDYSTQQHFGRDSLVKIATAWESAWDDLRPMLKTTDQKT